MPPAWLLVALPSTVEPAPPICAPPFDAEGVPFAPVSCSPVLEPHATTVAATAMPNVRTRAGECIGASARDNHTAHHDARSRHWRSRRIPCDVLRAVRAGRLPSAYISFTTMDSF